MKLKQNELIKQILNGRTISLLTLKGGLPEIMIKKVFKNNACFFGTNHQQKIF